MRLTLIGYWLGPLEEDWPNAQDFVDAEWSQTERANVISWLEAGYFIRFFGGLSTCRFCGCENGSGELTDGTYIWPEGLAHYLRDHGLRLPAAVVRHALSGTPIDISRLERAAWDGDYEFDIESWRAQLPDWSQHQVP